MENILRKLQEAKGPPFTETFRRQFLQKVFENLSSTPLSLDDGPGVFKLFLEWILVSDNPMLIEFGHKQLRSLSLSNPRIFRDFMNANLMIDVFTNTTHTNKLELGKLVSLLLTLLEELRPGDDGLRRSIVNVTKGRLFGFFRENGIHLNVAAEVSRLYQRHPDVLPNSSDWTNLSMFVVLALSGYRPPDCSEDADAEAIAEARETFFRDTEEVSKIFPLLWSQTEATDGIQECLKAFYSIISTEDSYNKPSCALSRIINKIPRPFFDVATKAILKESGQQQGEAKAVVALQTMIEWLTQYPSSEILSEWIQQMLRGLQQNDKNSVLIEIAHSTTEKLLLGLSEKHARPCVEPILFFLLLGFQHSESVFHSIVKHLPRTLATLEKSGNNMTLNRLGEASHFLIERFPDFPELYNSVLETLEEMQIPPPGKDRSEELKTLSWLSPLHTVTFANHITPRKKASSLVEDALAYRSETGMVGLINLGNTCYMNSVLQALYITKDFCNGVLYAPLTSSQVVLHRLQQAFAFLRFSQRSIYSPAEFLRSARPPWFEAGRQQDCSEFLRYLLDTLHEQEKNGRGKGVTVYGEHRIIDSTEASQQQHKQQILPHQQAEELTAMTKAPSRSSNLALDVISEAPENDQGREDEEMMSQGSEARVDEDFFGSRTSLSGPLGNPGIGTLGLGQGDEEADLRGSRTSLGSGLKRWTTEENLSSYDGSREGKMDLLDGSVIHDSHSNSTDSGIQSVGDSIRGSSDSMGGNSQIPADVAAKGLQQQQAQQSSSLTDNGMAPPPSSAEFVSLVQQIFGGKMQTSYTCSNCCSVSIHKEVFTELHLAVPEEEETTGEKAEGSEPRKAITVQTLLSNYLEPERLEAENKYHCDRCGGLQDAEKSMQILEGPDHLLCTLMRFKYDRALNRKSKIFTNVDYNQVLRLEKADELYSLYAAVVHSGYSSDGGHYYTYAREPQEGQEGEMAEGDDDSNVWYVFNDSKVSYATFDSFRTVSQRFPRDATYQLFYRKMHSKRKEDEPGPGAIKRPLRADLKMAVERDNVKFLREKERSVSTSAPTVNVLDKHWNNHRRDDEGGSGPNGGCGGGGFNSPGRLVY